MFLERGVYRESRIEYRIASVTVTQTAQVSVADQPIAERTP